jgi:hypothetical protein
MSALEMEDIPRPEEEALLEWHTNSRISLSKPNLII